MYRADLPCCVYDNVIIYGTYSGLIYYRTDTDDELEIVQRMARQAGAFDAVVCTHWAEGGLGARDLAEAVKKATQEPSNFKFLYDVKVYKPICIISCVHIHVLYITYIVIHIHHCINFRVHWRIKSEQLPRRFMVLMTLNYLKRHKEN